MKDEREPFWEVVETGFGIGDDCWRADLHGRTKLHDYAHRVVTAFL